MGQIWVYQEGLEAVQAKLRTMGVNASVTQAITYALTQFSERLEAGLTRMSIEPAYQVYVRLQQEERPPETHPHLEPKVEPLIDAIGARLEAMEGIGNLRWRGKYNKKLIILLAALTVSEEGKGR